MVIAWDVAAILGRSVNVLAFNAGFAVRMLSSLIFGTCSRLSPLIQADKLALGEDMPFHGVFKIGLLRIRADIEIVFLIRIFTPSIPFDG
jgi:hypothetical protein